MAGAFMPDDIEDEVDPVEGEDHKITAANQAAARAKRREEAAARELVFVKAGIDTDTAAGKLALDGYKGELTKDAVASWYAEVFPAAPVLNGSEISEGEKQLTEDRQFLATGGDPAPPNPTDEHPHARAMAAAAQHPMNRDKAAAAWLTETFGAAYGQHDGRVILTPVNHDGATRPLIG